MTSVNTDVTQVIYRSDPIPLKAEIKPVSSEPKVQDIKHPQLNTVDPTELTARLEKIISQVNDQIKDGGRGIVFSIDQALGRPVLTVKNQETGEFIRQIPGEDVVRIAHNIEKLKGILLNKSI